MKRIFSLALSMLIGYSYSASGSFRDRDLQLYVAAETGQIDKVRALLAAKANPNLAERTLGYNSLHVAAKWGYNDIVKALLDAGANIESVSSSGMTPLHLAAMGGRNEVVQTLLDAGADMEAKTSHGLTPLAEALMKDKENIARTLLERGAIPLDEQELERLQNSGGLWHKGSLVALGRKLQGEIIPQRHAAFAEVSKRLKKESAEQGQAGFAPYLESMVHDYAGTITEQRPVPRYKYQ